jgi:hypothetical protein
MTGFTGVIVILRCICGGVNTGLLYTSAFVRLSRATRKKLAVETIVNETNILPIG